MYRSSSPLKPSVALPPALGLFWIATLALGLLCALSELISAFILHLNGVYTWPALPFYDCIDLRCFQRRFDHFHSPVFFSTAYDQGPAFGYPAPGALLYEAFFGPHFHPFILFFVVTLAGLAFLAALLLRSMHRSGVSPKTLVLFFLPVLVFSHPLWFEFLLANMEVCIVLILAAGVLAFLRGSTWLAATLFSIAGAIKIFPLVFLGLLLARKQYRQVAYALVLLIPITLLSLWLVCPNLAIANAGIESGLKSFQDSYVLVYRPQEIGFDHSLFALIKQFLPFTSLAQTRLILRVYLFLAAAIGTTLYFTRIRRLPVLNQILALTIAAIFLPPLSHDYTLLHLYLPWGLLTAYILRERTRGRVVPFMTPVFLAFALLFAPLTEFIVSAQTVGGQIKAVVLAALFVITLAVPFESVVAAEAEESVLPDGHPAQAAFTS